MDLSRYEFIQSLRYCSSLSIELYDNKNRKIVCIPCIKGTISIKNSDKGNQECIGCLMHFKRVNIINLGHYYCKECPRNRLSDLNFPSYSESCDIENNFELNKILVDGELLECSKKIENSLGRDKNTLPYSTHCKCPNDSPRVIIRNSEFTMTCLSADLSKKIIDYKGLDYRLINTVKFSNIIYFYINCDPNRESVDLYETCLCPPGYIFSDYRCKQCTNGNLIDTNRQHYCLECKKSGILSLDGKDCSNYDFNFSETPDNMATHLKERNCFGNFVYTDNSCQLCEGKKVKSLKNNRCICPYSPKPQDKDCNVCVSDDVDSKNCECGGNSRLSANLCICGQNQFVNSNNECFDCEKGFITDHLSPNYCVCPAGKFIDNTGRSSKIKSNQEKKLNKISEHADEINYDYKNYQISKSYLMQLEKKSKIFQKDPNNNLNPSKSSETDPTYNSVLEIQNTGVDIAKAHPKKEHGPQDG
ncbi:MAG: hypothetical protein MHPSP_002517 [Paramarteilia canceri]